MPGTPLVRPPLLPLRPCAWRGLQLVALPAAAGFAFGGRLELRLAEP